MTPGEAKKGYSFISKISDSNASTKNEFNRFLNSFSNENKDKVDSDRLSFLVDEEDIRKLSPFEQIFDNVMESYVNYSLQEDAPKYKYIQSLSDTLTYICTDEDLVKKVVDLYKNYDDKLKIIEKNKKEDYIDEKLNNLIGLDNVKKQIKELANWAYITKLRKEKGLKANSITMHMVFTGSPGTGKTTVARIIADIYYNLGIIEENKLIETSREDLVAEYLGQSEIKTKKVLEESKGGVLFIDEAYSLTKNNDAYGSDVVNTILKFMEDNRDNTVIIIAGYQNEIEQFIKSNPGLKSRFNTYLTFNNYNSKELLEILKITAQINDYDIEDKVLSRILEKLNSVDTTDISFANARFVRNLFENATKNQATRLSSIGDITEKDLKTLTYEDFYS